MSLLAGAGACGRHPEHASRAPAVAATAREAPPPHTSPPEPGPGSVRLRIDASGLTLLANGAPRRPLLEELAARLHFELVAPDVGNEPVNVHVERGTLADALPDLLRDRSYRVDHRYDPVSHRHEIARLEVAPRGETDFPPPTATALAGSRGPVDADDAATSETPEDADAGTADPDRVDWKRLVRRLDDADADERIDALGRIDPRGEGMALLVDRLDRDPDPRVRAAAAERLEDADTLAGVDALVRALSDPDRRVVLAAIDALEFTEDYTVVDELEPLVNDPDPEISQAAVEARCFISSSACPDGDDGDPPTNP